MSYDPEILLHPDLPTTIFEPNIDRLPYHLRRSIEVVHRAGDVKFPDIDMTVEGAVLACRLANDEIYDKLWRVSFPTWNREVLADSCFGTVVQLKLLGHSWTSLESTLRRYGEPCTAAAQLVLKRFLLVCRYLHDNPDLLYTLGHEYTAHWTNLVQRYEPKYCDESWTGYASLRLAIVERHRKGTARYTTSLLTFAQDYGMSSAEAKKLRGGATYMRYVDQVNFFDNKSDSKTQKMPQDARKELASLALPKGTVAKALEREREVERVLEKVQFTPDKDMTKPPEREMEQLYDTMLRCYCGGIGTGKTALQNKLIEAAKLDLARPIKGSTNKGPELTLNFNMEEAEARQLFNCFDPFTKSKVALDSLYKKNYVDSKERPATDILRAYTLFSPSCAGDTPLTLTCGPYAGFKIADLKVKHELSGAYRATFGLNHWKCACGGLMRSELAWHFDRIDVSIHCESCGKIVLSEELLTCNPELRFRDFVNIVEWALTTAKVLNDSKCCVFPVAVAIAPSLSKAEVENLRKAILPTKRKRKNKEKTHE